MNKIVKEEERCQIDVHRSKEEIENLVKRLNRIDGQIKGIGRMLEEDRHCDDLLIQISASIQALKKIGEELLLHHMKTCMVEDIKNNNFETIDEVKYLFSRLK